MGEKFKCLLGFEQCEEIQRLRQENDSLWNFLRENDLEKKFETYDNRRKKGYGRVSYNPDYQQQYQTTKQQTPSPQPPPREVVLFIKADQGKSVIDHLRESKHLDEYIQNDLPYKTSHVWIGNGFDNSLFKKPESKSEIGYEYDFVAVKMIIPPDVRRMPNQTDTYELKQFIKYLCQQKVEVDSKNISNRLSIEELEQLSRNLNNINQIK